MFKFYIKDTIFQLTKLSRLMAPFTKSWSLQGPLLHRNSIKCVLLVNMCNGWINISIYYPPPLPPPPSSSIIDDPVIFSRLVER